MRRLCRRFGHRLNFLHTGRGVGDPVICMRSDCAFIEPAVTWPSD